jgi:hypothetical protein
VFSQEQQSNIAISGDERLKVNSAARVETDTKDTKKLHFAWLCDDS